MKCSSAYASINIKSSCIFFSFHYYFFFLALILVVLSKKLTESKCFRFDWFFSFYLFILASKSRMAKVKHVLFSHQFLLNGQTVEQVKALEKKYYKIFVLDFSRKKRKVTFIHFVYVETVELYIWVWTKMKEYMHSIK